MEVKTMKLAEEIMRAVYAQALVMAGDAGDPDDIGEDDIAAIVDNTINAMGRLGWDVTSERAKLDDLLSVMIADDLNVIGELADAPDTSIDEVMDLLGAR